MQQNNIRQPTKVRQRRTLSVSNSGYSEGGASYTKNSLKEFNGNSSTVLNDIDKNLDKLRKRSRNLYMTAPIATSAVNINRTNVIGRGLRLKSRINFEILGLSREEADVWEKYTEIEFSLWADSKFCDIKRLDNFSALQQIALMGWLLNGDAFAVLKKGTDTQFQPYSLRVQLIEADRITTPDSNGKTNLVKELKNGNIIKNGVEINKLGEVVAYHVCNAYPTDYVKKEWVRVPAFGEKTGIQNIIQVFSGERAEQYRGVPYLAPVIETLKQLTRYTESEVMAAVINAMFSIFIEMEQGGDERGFNGFEDDESNSNSNFEYKLGTGTINFLEPGEKISTVDPNRPNVNFDTFVSAMTKQIGGALEIPPDMLLKKFDKSYSASRAALMEAWKGFGMRRSWFADDFCQPIYEAWLSEAISLGRIKAPGYFRDPLVRKAWSGAIWNGPAQGQLDPVKEVNAAVERVANGFSTGEIETMSLTGGDFDSNIEQLKLEAQQMAEIEKLKQTT